MLIARLCASVRGKNVVGEVKGAEQMGMRVAGNGTRDRGRRKEVELNLRKRQNQADDSAS